VVWLWLRKGDQVCRLAGTVALVMIAGNYLLSLGNVRYFIALAPLSALAFARVLQCGFAQPRIRPATVVFGMSIAGVFLAGFIHKINTPHPHPWHDLVAAVQSGYKPGDVVVFDAIDGQIPFDYQARQQRFTATETGFPLPIYDWWSRQEFKAWGSPTITRDDLAHFITGLENTNPRTVWLVSFDAEYYDPYHSLQAGLSQHAHATLIPLPVTPDSSPQGDSPALIRFDLR
jgi:hypothetical protein